jgi:hypothetical protein
MRKSPILSVLAFVACLVVPTSANATWANNCSQYGPHCYALADWKMKGSGSGGGEEVKGLSSEINTTAMSVPLWEGKAFVDDEQWMAQYQTNKWVEDGQMAGGNYQTEEGREVNGQSLHWFYAFNTGNIYSEYEAPWTYPGWTWISYTLSDPGSNGSWCEKIGTVQVACQGGFSKYGTEVQVGMEAADEVRPENSGKDRTGVQHLDGNWAYWNKAEWWMWNAAGSTKDEQGYGICTTGFENIAGYVNWGTC